MDVFRLSPELIIIIVITKSSDTKNKLKVINIVFVYSVHIDWISFISFRIMVVRCRFLINSSTEYRITE